MEKVRTALGRRAPLTVAPAPPAIDESITRLIHDTTGLSELFQKRAIAMKMLVEIVRGHEVARKITDFLKERGSKTAMLSDTPLLQRLGITAHLNQSGISARNWSELTADQAYDIDAGITEADYAVAETGTLAIRHRAEHGRLLSLVPFVHVAVIEPRIIVADLLDFFARISKEGTGSGMTLISGPSKTADIEMNTVTGVHGPNLVKTFIVA